MKFNVSTESLARVAGYHPWKFIGVWLLILIAAAALGLGAVWLGSHGNPEREHAIRGVLGIPDSLGVLSLLSIGHPDEEKPPRTQYDARRVHRDRW